MDFHFLPFRIICSVFRILDLLFCVLYVAILAFRILPQPIFWVSCEKYNTCHLNVKSKSEILLLVSSREFKGMKGLVIYILQLISKSSEQLLD